ncbi:MAG: ATP-binding cassette domain-containing protein [Cryomorphaceae bacterium]
MTDTAPMLQVTNLRKSFGDTEVLNIPELRVEVGEIVGVVGNNGAGKTTLFSLVLDLVKPTSGTATLKGEDVSKHEGWKQYTAPYLDEGFLIEFLRPDEYFQFIGSLHGLSANDTDAFTAQFEDVSNGEVLGSKKLLRELSKGNQKKAGLIGTLIGNPELVIWDEPFANLDPSTQIRIKDLVRLHGENRTFLISSHDLNHVYDVCDRIVVIEQGAVVKDVRKSETTLEALYGYFLKKDEVVD